MLQLFSYRWLCCLYSGTSLSYFRTDSTCDIVARFENGISDFFTLLCISVMALSHSSAASFQMVELELLHCPAYARKLVSEACLRRSSSDCTCCRSTECKPSVSVV